MSTKRDRSLLLFGISCGLAIAGFLQALVRHDLWWALIWTIYGGIVCLGAPRACREPSLSEDA